MSDYFSSGSHYYRCSNGIIEAAYDAGLREARADNLYVSPTTVAYVRSNPVLDMWKQSLLVDTVLSSPQFHSESVEDYKKRIKELVRKPAGDAASFGTNLHEALERYPQMPVDASLLPWCEEYGRWHEQNVAETLGNEIMLAHHGIGVAGKTDRVALLKDGRIAVCDYKSQGIKPGKKANAYDSWSWQIAFYAEAYKIQENLPVRPTCINLIIDSNKPSPPIVKEWTSVEIDEAWKCFVLHAWLWSHDKGHWPVGRWEVTDFVNR